MPYNEIRSSFSGDSEFFFSGNKSGFAYYVLCNYYPKNRFPDIGGNNSLNRQAIWRFKDGDDTLQVGRAVLNAMKKQFKGIDFRTYTCCIIPASTQQKTFTRFVDFTSYLSKNLGMQDGYLLISCKEDHDATKGNSDKKILNFLSFDVNAIKGRKIFLFDDVFTTGRSFFQCAGQLRALGALQIIGIFLGKTVSQMEQATIDSSTSKTYNPLDDEDSYQVSVDDYLRRESAIQPLEAYENYEDFQNAEEDDLPF